MLKKMTNVLVVGSGLTGAATVAALRQSMPDNTTISIWDKARGAGEFNLVLSLSFFSPTGSNSVATF